MRRKGASSPPPLSMLGHHRYLLKQLSLDCKASIEPVVSDEERSPLAFPQILPGNEDSCSPRMDYNLVADKVSVIAIWCVKSRAAAFDPRP